MTEGGTRRGAVFAVLVAMLAAVGIYLTVWSGPGDDPRTGAGPTGADRTVAGSAQAPPAEPARPAATASNAPFDVYSYLPMTKQELAAAADYAQRFTAEYGTFRHDEDPAVYGDRLKGYTTEEFAAVLLRTVTSAGTIEANKADEIVSVGSAKVSEIRQIDSASVVFVVVGTQDVTARSGTARRTAEYAVTLIQAGTEWRVHDLQPADSGQEGDDQPQEGVTG
ncbi:hypothetical protein FHS43_004765 [Streptosporangium becharense]|uniref:Mce-associated membrane protein n=1 Tax=Streptosporangium becharense TaxID=1816182 RepID=A0A7W9IIY6_9ACTN|nr:hypothetical protein [Streptosporangium becharense]MBB2913461.1 hypothetical protein [Streptosporangium becharense]MBB5821151.1 hypothetical protein [Streptosporangium becharense]